MLTVSLALASALLYGTGDFAGGILARRAPIIAALFVSAVLGTGLLWAISAGVDSWHLTRKDLWLGLFTGLLGAIAVTSFCVALAKGTMSVVAPVTALTSALVPVAAGLVKGERPGVTSLVGVVLALVAIGLVSSAGDHEAHAASSSSSPRTPPRILLMAAVAGLMFGTYYSVLHETTESSGTWPVMLEHLGVAICLGLVLLVMPSQRAPIAVLGSAAMPLLVNSVFDSLANAAYVLAAHRGLLSLVAVISAMYPATTVLLARIVLGERLAMLQRVGVATAIVAVGLVALGSA